MILPKNWHWTNGSSGDTLMHMIAFTFAALLLIMVPGPDQALITRNALRAGRIGGVVTVMGGVLGVAVHATAAAAGLSALLMASAGAFLVLKIVGAAYLVWLGIMMLRSARDTGQAIEADRPSGRSSYGAYLRQGFLSNALNPKVALFFVTFLPQFLPKGSTSPRADALVLAAVFAGLYVLWFGLYVGAIDGLGRWLRRPRVRALLERITAVFVFGVAARLAIAVHP
jgi:threonine/homoserine/homoserine lactone efflux protein